MSGGRSLLPPPKKMVNITSESDYLYYSDASSSSDEHHKLKLRAKSEEYLDTTKTDEEKPAADEDDGQGSFLVPSNGDDIGSPIAGPGWEEDPQPVMQSSPLSSPQSNNSILSPPDNSSFLAPPPNQSPLALGLPPPPTPQDNFLLPKPRSDPLMPINRQNLSLELLPTPVAAKQKPDEMIPSPVPQKIRPEVEDKILDVYEGLPNDVDDYEMEVIPAAESFKFDSDLLESQNPQPQAQNNFDYMASTIDDVMQSGAVQYYSGSSMLNSIPLDGNIDGLEASAMPVFASFSKFTMPSAFEEMILQIRTCEACNKEILDNYSYINGYYYHEDCVKCYSCEKHVDDENCFVVQGRIMCKDCIIQAQKYVCTACKEPILSKKDKVKLEGGDSYHTTCLGCYKCGVPLTPTTFIEMDNKTFCKTCYEKINKTICHKCEKPIENYEYICHNGQCFHMDHFRCCICDEVLKGNQYIVHHNKFFCMKHGSPIIDSCAFCKRRFNFVDDKLKWHDKFYHSECLICRVCGTKLTTNSAKSIHNRPHCQECYSRRLMDERSDSKKKHLPSEMKERREAIKKSRKVIDFTYRPKDVAPLEGPPQAASTKPKFAVPKVDELTVYA